MWIQNSKISQRTITKYRKERKAHTHTHTQQNRNYCKKTENIKRNKIDGQKKSQTPRHQKFTTHLPYTKLNELVKSDKVPFRKEGDKD
jgi:hypothetical protein